MLLYFKWFVRIHSQDSFEDQENVATQFLSSTNYTASRPGSGLYARLRTVSFRARRVYPTTSKTYIYEVCS